MGPLFWSFDHWLFAAYFARKAEGKLRFIFVSFDIYRRTSNIRGILVGNNIVDHSDVFGASFVSAAPTTSLFST